MTQCSGTCAGYRYYGLQGGNECFCGNTYARWGGAGDCTGCGISDRTGGAFPIKVAQPFQRHHADVTRLCAQTSDVIGD